MENLGEGDGGEQSWGNYSFYQPWVSAYMECVVAVSPSLNLSVSENVWLSMLHSAENSTALGTVVTSAGDSENSLQQHRHHSSGTDVGHSYNNDSFLSVSEYASHALTSGVSDYTSLTSTTSLPALSLSTETEVDLVASTTQGNSKDDVIRVVNMVANWCLSQVATDHRPYLLPWWQQVLWTLAFGMMLTVAIGGNSLVMWIVCAHKRMRTVTNYFLMNLSGADLLMSVLNCMFNFIYMLHSDWPFGSIYCTISNFMANVTIAASVFTLMAISFDRYIAIVRPLEPRMSKTMARVFIAVIWIASASLAVPCALYSTTVTVTYKDDKIRRGCIMQWPDGQTSASHQEHIYNIVFFITTYLLPMLMMFGSYSLISRELWGSQHIGELTMRQVNIIRSKRRVVRMFIVIVVIFALCWLPQQAFFLYQYHNAQVLDTAHVQHIYLAFYWLAMANAMVNPVIYYWMNARFRSYFREVIMQCLCLRLYQKHHRSYTASPVLERRCMPSCPEEASSRSRSDSHGMGNGTERTLPGSLPYRSQRQLLYSCRDRTRSEWRSPKSAAQCEICLQSFQPSPHCNFDSSAKPVNAVQLRNSPVNDNITTRFGARVTSDANYTGKCHHMLYNQRISNFDGHKPSTNLPRSVSNGYNSAHNLNLQRNCRHNDPSNAHFKPNISHKDLYDGHLKPNISHNDLHDAHLKPNISHNDLHDAHLKPNISHNDLHDADLKPNVSHSDLHDAHLKPNISHNDLHDAHLKPSVSHSDLHDAHLKPNVSHNDLHDAHLKQNSSHNNEYDARSLENIIHPDTHGSHTIQNTQENYVNNEHLQLKNGDSDDNINLQQQNNTDNKTNKNTTLHNISSRDHSSNNHTHESCNNSKSSSRDHTALPQVTLTTDEVLREDLSEAVEMPITPMPQTEITLACDGNMMDSKVCFENDHTTTDMTSPVI